jgi:hypothetical protein
MDIPAQKLVLTVPAAKMGLILAILKDMDFVKVESLEDIVKRYVRTAPQRPALSDEEISDILSETRYGKNMVA